MQKLRPSVPGLFVTGTDTNVGKTVAACAIAVALRQQLPQGQHVGVCKPAASGCRRQREGLVSDDAMALAHFADCRLPLDVINPLRFAPPLAPGIAAEQAGEDVDLALVTDSLRRIGEVSDAILVEGAGGVLVPLDPRGRVTVLDLAAAIGYPVIVVSRSTLGTINHTAMTVRMLRDAGCRVAGVVMNQYPTDAGRLSEDPSISSNRAWIERMARTSVLATLPLCDPRKVQVDQGVLDDDVIEAAAMCYWPDVLSRPSAR